MVLEIRQFDIGGRRRWVARNTGAPVPERASRFDVTDDPYQRLGDLRADLDRLAAALDR